MVCFRSIYKILFITNVGRRVMGVGSYINESKIIRFMYIVHVNCRRYVSVSILLLKQSLDQGIKTQYVLYILFENNDEFKMNLKKIRCLKNYLKIELERDPPSHMLALQRREKMLTMGLGNSLDQKSVKQAYSDIHLPCVFRQYRGKLD